MRIEEINQYKTRLYRIAAKYKIKQIFVFGSVACGESGEISDIDLLIEMDETASAYGVGGFQYEAEKLLGVRIDVIPTFVLPRISDHAFVHNIQDEAVAL